MHVTKEHHEDRSEPDDRGMYDWSYVYDVYTFSDGELELKFRRYSDDAATAALVSPMGCDQLVGCQALLGAAIEHLRETEGIASVQAYDPGRGAFSPFGNAVRSAAASGKLSQVDADCLVDVVDRSRDAV